MHVVQCVVTGDGAVGKVRTYRWLRLKSFSDQPLDMSPHLLRHERFPGRIYTHSV